MSLPAAVSPDPIAVLVLAWDEATPALRALVEATQASAPPLDSLLVLVPQPDGPRAEAYPPPPADLPALPLPETTVPLPAAEPLLAVLEAPTVDLAPPAHSLPTPGSPFIEADEPLRAAPLATASQPTSPTWAAVRVVQVGRLSAPAMRPGQALPVPIWAGTPVAPAAPYLGATPPAAGLALPAAAQADLPTVASVLALDTNPLPAAGLLATPAVATELPAPPSPAAPTLPALAPLYTPADSLAQAPDLETDFALAEADALMAAEADESNSLPAEEFAIGPENTLGQANWSAIPEALPQPSPQPEPVVAVPTEQPAAPPASPVQPALRPADQQYPAPDLNYQIIQYARLAVPRALAEPDFAAIYAPAWPTWLAAQELRQRTGQPLVLHVATLAAADNESADTAAGWVAELQRQALRRADLILAETPALAQRLRRELGLSHGTVLVIPAAEAEAVAQALRTAQPKPAA